MQVRQGYILEKHAVGRVDRYDRIATGRCRRCERGGRVGKYSISKFENILTGSEVGDGILAKVGAEHERVISGSARERIVAGTASNCVVSRRTGDRIVAGGAA